MAHPDRLSGHEALQQVEREVVRAKIERHADRAIRELLRRVDRRRRRDHDGAIGDDGAATELAALDAGLLDAAVVAPFARVVHVGLTLFEEAAVTRERVQSARTGDINHRLLRLRAGVTVDPFDVEPFLLEQALVVGDQLGQTLERGGRLQYEPLHGTPPGSFSAVLHGRCPASYLTLAARSSCPLGRAHRLSLSSENVPLTVQ